MGADLPCYNCISQPGDVVAFNMRCYHSAWGGQPNRRMCTIVYYENPVGPIEEEYVVSSSFLCGEYLTLFNYHVRAGPPGRCVVCRKARWLRHAKRHTSSGYLSRRRTVL
jgi:hypothetical protein